MAQVTGLSVEQEAAGHPGDRELEAWAIRSQMTYHISAMLTEAQTLDPITVTQDFDRDPELLNCNNGTLHLLSGELRPHRQEDMISRLVPTDYVPWGELTKARRKFWEAVVRYAIPTEETRNLFQEIVGHALSGLPDEEVMTFLKGPSKTGKSTLLDAVVYTLGDYARVSNASVLVGEPNKVAGDRARADLVELEGYRVVVIMEFGRHTTLNGEVFKLLSDRSRFRARDLYQGGRELSVVGKFLIGSNHLPAMDHEDDAQRNRFQVVPVTRVIPPEKRDPSVKVDLRDPDKHGAVVLSWLVEGFKRWQAADRVAGSKYTRSPEVEEATAREWGLMDECKPFLDGELEFGPDKSELISSMRAAFERWCRNQRVKLLSSAEFNKRLEAMLPEELQDALVESPFVREGGLKSPFRKVVKVGAVSVRKWFGVGLATPEEEEAWK
jgi:putative DNA primase/helicase